MKISRLFARTMILAILWAVTAGAETVPPVITYPAHLDLDANRVIDKLDTLVAEMRKLAAEAASSQNLSGLARLDIGVDPTDFFGVGRDDRVD